MDTVREFVNMIQAENRLGLLLGSIVFLISLTMSTVLTSAMCAVSRRLGFLDRPDGKLKCHNRATPTMGGIPLFLAMSAGVAVLVLIVREWFPLLGWNRPALGLIGAVVMILLIGICDDLHRVKPFTKLFFQMLAALILVASGVLIRECAFFQVFDWHLGILAVPFTLFWLIGSCNAFNFIDGMDGLASGLGAVMALILAVLAIISGQYLQASLALALAGGLLGILLFNFNPARIFLGDTGSQLTGILLGTLTIQICTENNVFVLPAAGLIMSIPIFDALFSIIRRYGRGKSLVLGDQKHLHHCLRNTGFSVRSTAMLLWAAAAYTGFMAAVFRFSEGVPSGLAALAFVGVEVYIGVRLGCVSGCELRQRLAGVLTGNTIPAGSQAVDLEELWDRMKPYFEQLRLDRAVLTLEALNEHGRKHYKTYQWVRTADAAMRELLAQRCTRSFSLGDDQPRIATLQIESEQLRRDEEHMDWLLDQIRENFRRNRYLGKQVI